MKERQAFGIQWTHNGTELHQMGIVMFSYHLVPQIMGLNVSNSENIVIQMGNGPAADQTTLIKFSQ